MFILVFTSWDDAIPPVCGITQCLPTCFECCPVNLGYGYIYLSSPFQDSNTLWMSFHYWTILEYSYYIWPKHINPTGPEKGEKCNFPKRMVSMAGQHRGQRATYVLNNHISITISLSIYIVYYWDKACLQWSVSIFCVFTSILNTTNNHGLDIGMFSMIWNNNHGSCHDPGYSSPDENLIHMTMYIWHTQCW